VTAAETAECRRRRAGGPLIMIPPTIMIRLGSSWASLRQSEPSPQPAPGCEWDAAPPPPPPPNADDPIPGQPGQAVRLSGVAWRGGGGVGRRGVAWGGPRAACGLGVGRTNVVLTAAGAALVPNV
jgi:hypothetical protein